MPEAHVRVVAQPWSRVRYGWFREFPSKRNSRNEVCGLRDGRRDSADNTATLGMPVVCPCCVSGERP